MSIPSSPVPPPVIPIFNPTEPLTPSASTTPGLVSTLTQAEQQMINSVVLGSHPISPSTTAFFEASLVGLNQIAHEMHMADFLDALRAMQSQLGIQSIAQAFKLMQEELMVNFKAAMINIDEINSESDKVNTQVTNVTNTITGYNTTMTKLQGYADTYNQAQVTLQQAISNYNGSATSLNNYKNAVSALNTAANDYNNFRSSIINAQPGQAAFAVKDYLNAVDSYNAEYGKLVSLIQSKNTQIDQLNATNLAQDPSYPQAPTQPLPTVPLGQLVAISSAQTLPSLSTIASNSPPPKTVPQPVLSAYNPINFTFNQTSSSPPGYTQAPYPSSQLNSLIQQWNSAVSTFNSSLSQMQSQGSTVKNNLDAVNAQAKKNYSTNPAQNQFSASNYNSAVNNYNQSVATYNGYANNVNGALSTLQSLGSQINNLLGKGQGVQVPQSVVQANGGEVPNLSFNFISAGLVSPGAQQTVDLPPPASTVNTTTPPPQNVELPQQINASFTPVSFTPGEVLPTTPTSTELGIQFAFGLINLFITYITSFSSLSQVIQESLKGRVDKSLILLHSFLSAGKIPEPPKSNTSNAEVGSTGSSAGFVAAGSSSVDAQNMINTILQNQTYQNVLSAIGNNNPGLQQILGNNGLPQNMQLELLALLGTSKTASGLLSVQLLQNLIHAGGNVSDQLNSLVNAVALLSIFLKVLGEGAIGAPSGTTPGVNQTDNVKLQTTLTALLLAAAFLGEAVGNNKLLLPQLLVALNAASATSADTVAHNLSQLLVKLSAQQSDILQHQLQSSLTAALSSTNVSANTISQLSQDLAKATSAQQIKNAINASLANVNASALQSAINAIDLTASLLSLNTENAAIDASALASNILNVSNQNADILSNNLKASNILSGVINDQIQRNIQNAVELALQSNKVPNPSSIAKSISSSAAELSKQQLPDSAFIAQLKNAIHEALGPNDNLTLENTILASINNTIFTEKVTQTILAGLQNQNLVTTTTNISKELAEIINKIGSSFSKTLHEVAKTNDEVYLKKTIESFRTTIINLTDFNVFVQEVLSPGKTMVGLMYEGMKEGFHKGWLDFAV